MSSMKIAILGAGNVGTAMACYMAQDHDVYMHSSKPDAWNNDIVYKDKVTGSQFVAKIKCVTDRYDVAVENADVIFITYPSFMVEAALDGIAPYLKKGAKVGIVPGTGGAEFTHAKVLEKGAEFFGMDRVPCVARIEEYGKSVIASKKAKTRLAAIPNAATEEIAQTVSDLLDMEIEALSNYLIVTFTASNPIVHTARLFAMLRDRGDDASWERNIPFYAEWDDEASEIMMGCDDELHQICDVLDKLDMSGVVPLTKHYEVETVSQMSAKIRSIESMQHILSPMVEKDGRFVIDKESRYFKEDMPYGLCVVKGFAVICGVETPYIDSILQWYEGFGNVEYFVQGDFVGKDLKEAAIPQNFGIETKAQVYDFYLQ